ncbi:MAG TPA: biotin--[acetyl-CoA-carboxylase] ligase [Verrucomicrobiae bacterium]|nr:biotin--[acetyl-CoA-carboxylase] ligase [Verrucomicrobiae bacterium]
MSIDARILQALRSSSSGSISGAELSQQLGISRAAVWARIEELRRLGYDIEASPHQGYRLLKSPDALHADDLTWRLESGRKIGRDIRVFEQTTSTNDVIEKLAQDGVPEGIVVFAESQTAGRGRLGRRWVSPARKGLWFSVLLRPNIRPSAATQMTVAAATALRHAIESETQLKSEIKWPNDILISGKKVAGILTELSAELDRVKYLIVGIGVDVNLGPDDLPNELKSQATSLQIESGKPVARVELAAAILRELEKVYQQVLDGDFATVADEWEHHCSTLGRRLVIQLGDRRVSGRAEALGEDGALLLRTEHGHLERIVGGDVQIEK